MIRADSSRSLACGADLEYRNADVMRFGPLAPSLAASVLVVACSSSSPSPGASAPAGPAASGDAGSSAAPTLSADGTPPACTSGTGGPLPSPRGDVSGALDPSGRRFVVHGGDVAVPICGQPPAPKVVDETWILDVACGTWRSVPPDGGPGARSRHAMATDASRNRALLFGGRVRGSGSAYTLFDDVWAFDFATETWSKLATEGKGPSPRSNASIGVDGDRLVVFGGNTSTDGLAFAPENDAYALDLSGDTPTWSAIGGATKPPARLFHAMAIDRARHVAYVYGGGDEQAFTGPFLNDLWALDLESGAWREVKQAGDPPVARIHAGMMFDDADKVLVVFGGHDDGQLGNENDVHRIDPAGAPAAWSRVGEGDRFHAASSDTCDFPADFSIIDDASPERRSAFAFGARADGHGFVVAFGKSDCGVLADAWWWSGGPGAFQPLRENPAGLSCLRFSTTCTNLCN
jgi:hypothetical protein